MVPVRLSHKNDKIRLIYRGSRARLKFEINPYEERRRIENPKAENKRDGFVPISTGVVPR